jgi:hypothetical protein
MAPSEEYAPPTLEDVRDWIGVPETTISDEQLQTVLDSEEGAQAQLCRIDPWAPQLTNALYRRVARVVAAMALPLGVIGSDSEFGGANLPRYDAEIERIERPFRLVVIG